MTWWTLSCEHAIEINVDTTWNMKMRSIACGFIFHDCKGIVLVNFSYLIVEAFDTPSIEDLILTCTSQKTLKKGLSRVILEFACAFIVNKFNSQTLHLSLYDHIIWKILRICESFNVVSFSFIHRVVNCLTHWLANWMMDGNVALEFSLNYSDFVHWLILDDTL